MIKWNFKQFTKDIDAGVRGAEIEFTRQLQFVAEKTLEKLASYSPQWSGNFAANWALGVNKYNYTDYDDSLKGDFEQDKADLQKIRSDRAERARLAAVSGVTQAQRNLGLDSGVKFRGDREAIDQCLANNADNIASITSYKSRLFYSNQTPYGKNIAINTREDGKSPYLRPGNWVAPHPIPIGAVQADLAGAGLGALAREGRRAMRSKS